LIISLFGSSRYRYPHLLAILLLGLVHLAGQSELTPIRIGKGRFDRPVFTNTHGLLLTPRQLENMIMASGDEEAIRLFRTWESVRTVSGVLIFPALGALAYGTATFIFPGLDRSLPILLAGIAGSMVTGGVRFEFQERLVAAVERYNEVIQTPPD
jgi:hypothetical protein